MFFSFWLVSLVFLFTGTWLTVRRVKAVRAKPDPRPVSILKPLRGLDPGLEENLESFFQLSHSQFELLFSVTDKHDPAVPMVESLIKKYPRVCSRLIQSEEIVGLNPKVNNLAGSLKAARYEIILISDSNIRAKPDYLDHILPHLNETVGVVTSVVAGIGPDSFGGELEATYLNTFYARAMNLGFATGNPFVIGKSMMFHKETAAKLGGFEVLGAYIAEDYAFGFKAQKLGLKIALTSYPACQHIGFYSLKAFWDRHTRWGKIRKSHAPIAFLVEPLAMAIPSATLAGIALADFCPFWAAMLFHLGLVAAADAYQAKIVSGRAGELRVWLVREIFAIPLWLAAALSSSVNWRGNKITILRGGKIKVREEQCNESHFYGEPRPAPTRLKVITSTVIGGSGRKPAILREG